MMWNDRDDWPETQPELDGPNDGNGKSTATMAPKRSEPPRRRPKVNTTRLVVLWVLRLALLAGLAYYVIQAYS